MSRSLLLCALSICASCSSLEAQNSIAVVSHDEAAARRQLERGLATRVSLEFERAAFDLALRELLQPVDVRFAIDRRALDEWGIDVETPVSIALSGVTVRTFLKRMLHGLELTWILRGELLLVTTLDEAEANLETRVYPVPDLVAVVGFPRDPDYDTLIMTIQDTIAPDSWDQVGGPGAIDSFPNAQSIVISQTTEVHDLIERLMTTLRRVRRAQGLPILVLPAERMPTPKSAPAVRKTPAPTVQEKPPRHFVRPRRGTALYGVVLGY